MLQKLPFPEDREKGKPQQKLNVFISSNTWKEKNQKTNNHSQYQTVFISFIRFSQSYRASRWQGMLGNASTRTTSGNSIIVTSGISGGIRAREILVWLAW